MDSNTQNKASNVPKFPEFNYPVLLFFRDGQEHTLDDLCTYLEDYFHLTDDDLLDMIPSGRQSRFMNRIDWSLTYLRKALCLEKNSKQQSYTITQRGIDLLNSGITRITGKELSQYDEFRNFWNRNGEKTDRTDSTSTDEDDSATPEDSLENAYSNLTSALADELLDKILDVNPYMFEVIVMSLLRKMGYGGISDESMVVTRKSNDEGIDGIINQDELGLDKIFMQAKRWKASVGREEIQKFIGALSTKKADKGIFITTSTYNSNAIECAKNSDKTVVLIDGRELARLMVEYGVGVQTVHSYEVKKIDADFFDSYK
ncbi:restriction endonuclease [Candidatus Saccharibacteria bacterium]|nr:restriction endonuclease [Candidatus Saccharibacteria bacterium]